MMSMRRAVGMALCLFAVALPALASDLTISNFRVRGPSGGNDEFVELHNGSSTALDVGGYTLLGSNASGTTGTRATLPAGTSIAPGCYLLLTNGASSGYSGSVSGDVVYKTGITDTGGMAIADVGGTVLDQVGLSDGSAYGEGTRLASLGSTNADQSYARISGAAGRLQDTDNNAVDFTLQSPSLPHNAGSTCSDLGLAVSVADAVIDEGDSGATALTFRLTLSRPAPSPMQVRFSTADGAATVADGDYDAVDKVVSFAAGDTVQEVAVTVHGDSKIEPDEDFAVRLSEPSSGLAIARGEAIGGILNDDAAQVEIFQIQGNGDSSPFVGQPVITRNNIVTSVGPAGFTMQTPDRRDDHDRLTSNGVYVFTSSAPQVKVGDAVDVRARVAEYHGLTELTGASITVLNSGNRLPLPVLFGHNLPSTDPAHLSCGTTNFECFEGMRVLIINGIVDRGNQRYGNDPFAEVFVSAGGIRSLRSQGVTFGLPASDIRSGVWDGNPEVFEMDADALDAVPAGTGINGGARFIAEGVMSYSFGDYDFQPTALHILDANTMPRPVHDRRGPDTLRVGNLNMLRLCDTDGGNSTYECGDGGTPTAAELQLKLQRLSAYIGGVLKLPDVLGAEEVESLPVLEQLATQLNNDYGVHYSAHLVDGHDPSGIDVGLLVQDDRVQIASVTQLGYDATWVDPATGQSAYLHDRPPLLLEGTKLGRGSFSFRLMVVHPKSLIGVDSGADATRNRLKRFSGAKDIAQRVQALQTDAKSGFEPLVVLGDFNAYPFTDGWTDVVGAIAGSYDDSANLLDLGGNIVKPALWNAVQSVPANDRYSFLFTQQLGEIQGYQRAGSFDSGRDVPVAQVLDQALLDRLAQRCFRGFEYGRGNLDAPDQTQHDAAGDSGIGKAIGVSDHDGFVLDLACPGLAHGRH
ncbi:Calx-beta domain-containing protein [Rhodanobacter ginsengiterrae]|uniref:Calx-beta domain-containing protein n=1 Tax=Rhodanobacter ginsengiterrae TaxID=2008451 RepID=UPI003CEADB49